MTTAVLTIDQVADLLQVSAYRVRAEIAAGRLRAARIGRDWRVRPGDVDAYLATATGAATPTKRRGRAR